MKQIIGTLLHTKEVTSKKGRQFTVVSILDEYENYTEVVDITDFDGYVNGAQKGELICLPYRSRPGVSERGNAYINYVTVGKPDILKRIAD